MVKPPVAIYDRSTLSAVDWPETGDGGYARRYLSPFIEAGPLAYVANAFTDMRILRVGNQTLPITITKQNPENTYTCSPTSHYISYTQEELQTLNNPPLETTLRLFFQPLAAYLRQAQIDRALLINNWLLSTNLYPAFTPAEITAALQSLTDSFPDHAIIFRSVDSYANPLVFNTLAGQGARMIFSRSVWYQEPASPQTTRRQHYKADLRLFRRTPYRITTADQLTDTDFPRLVELYNLLYLNKYSHFNPQFTEAFLRLAAANNLLTLKAFRRDGQIDAVLGYFTRHNGQRLIGTPPIFGYDTRLPRSLGLYRLVSTLFSLEAARHNFLANFSAGVGGFKRNRGCLNAIEYNAVFINHLPPWRQRPWRLLQFITDHIAIPLIKSRGL